MTDLFTVREAIQRSAHWLQSRGSDAPRLDAELLLAHTLDCERMELFLRPERPLNGAESDRYRALIRRRGEQEPVAYILGTTGFWNYDFLVDERALLPRPETEGIVRAVLDAAGDKRDHALRIVDVGTGSGVLAITLALEFPKAQVVAIDTSADALELSRDNAQRHGVADRVHLVAGDILSPLVGKGSRADIIVSNPPYVGESERHLMSPGVERWEPASALFAGEDGFETIDRLLAQIPHTLDAGGMFVMEFGAPQAHGIRERATRRFRNWEIRKDYGGHDRLLVVHAPGTRQWRAASGDISERDADGAATSPLEDISRDANHLEHDAMRYGGADGTEPLPEIDLHADFDNADGER